MKFNVKFNAAKLTRENSFLLSLIEFTAKRIVFIKALHITIRASFFVTFPSALFVHAREFSNFLKVDEVLVVQAVHKFTESS